MVQKKPNFSGNRYFDILLENGWPLYIYEIWGGLKLLKGIFLGKTYVHTMYSECTGSLIQVSPQYYTIIYYKLHVT
jgi:hypothetical protein